MTPEQLQVLADKHPDKTVLVMDEFGKFRHCLYPKSTPQWKLLCAWFENKYRWMIR